MNLKPTRPRLRPGTLLFKTWSTSSITRTCMEVLLVLRALSLVYASVESQTFRQARGWTLTGVWLWTDSNVRSPVQCISVCGRTQDCYAVGFSKFNKSCSYYHWFLGSIPLKAILGADHERVIPVRPIQILHLSGPTDYFLTFNESVGMCADFGGRLATYDELKAVWLLGYHKCRCGWLENGSAYFPSHSDSVDCGSAIQINVCAGGTTYDAYCTTMI